jgi:hypothetical protein
MVVKGGGNHSIDQPKNGKTIYLDEPEVSRPAIYPARRL